MSDLIKMARVLERMAQDLRREAMSVDKSNGEIDRLKAAAARWPQEYADAVETGIDPETAILQIAIRDRAPMQSVAYHVRAAARDDDRQRIELRNREILRLARTGWTNRQLGEKYGLHPVTISRIIRRALDA
jgi:DNA-binding CsgD family transcriptional regulator